MAFQSLDAGRPRLLLRGIQRDYGQLRALKGVDFSLNCAELHAVVGEHGAGKSSLGMIIGGLLKPQSGQLIFEEQTYRSLTVKMAGKLGIEMVHQHALSLNTHFTVAENFALTNMPLFTRKKKLLHAAEAFFAEHQIGLDPALPVEQLNAADQIFVDILKHLFVRPKLLILDEALEKLTSAAFNKIVSMLTAFKRAGMSILLITHRIDDIYTLADRVSIIKHGEILLTDGVKHIDKINLIKMAYTQISAEQQVDDLNQEFYHLLKYNEAILRHLPVNLIVTDTAHRIKLVNDYCKSSFRLNESSYLNTPLVQLFSSANDDAAQLIQQAFSYTEEKTFYQVPITVNGLHTISTIKTFPIYDGVFLIGTIIILEDLTEYDRLQKQVMLSEKLASVGLLAAGVAHEINNPLEIIYTYLSYMKYRFCSAELDEALDTVQEEMTQIADIVSNLRSFSENQASDAEEIEINHEIRNVLNLIKHNANYKHIAIHADLAAQDLRIRANKHEIKQVLLNLLKNSFEAMPAGGAIEIQTRTLETQDTQWAQILFKDTGPGIGDDNPNNIFLPFYSTKKGTGDNLGLGLSVSYGIITKYHGTMTVENNEQAGCQFVITLPQAR